MKGVKRSAVRRSVSWAISVSVEQVGMDFGNEDLHESTRECERCHDMLYIKVDDVHQRLEFQCINNTCDASNIRPQERITAKMQFCPICRHMTRVLEGPDQKLQVKCTRQGCTYIGTAINTLVHSQNHRKVIEDAAINWRDMTLDKTLQKSYGAPCAKPDCDSDELLLFQIQSANGVESYGICTVCKYHWLLH